MNTKIHGMLCLLAFFFTSNGWGASIQNPSVRAEFVYTDLGASNNKIDKNFLVGIVRGVLYEGPKFNLQKFDGKIAFNYGRKINQQPGYQLIKRYKPRVSNIATPLHSALVLLGSAIVGLVVVGRRIPDKSYGDAIV